VEIEERFSQILRRLDRKDVDSLEKSGLEGTEPPREQADDQACRLAAAPLLNSLFAIKAAATGLG